MYEQRQATIGGTGRAQAAKRTRVPSRAARTSVLFAWLALATAAPSGCVEVPCPSGTVEREGACTAAGLNGAEADPSPDANAPDANAPDASEPDAGTADASPSGAPLDEPASDAGAACERGFELEGAQCVRNPCEPLPGEFPPCHEHATCSYEGAGEVTCACNPGYDGDGTTCVRNACAELDGEPPPCAANETCTITGPAEKTCACAEGFADCDESRDNGCEIDTSTDPEHCGACGATCATGLACREGRCAERVTTMALSARNTCALSPEGQVLCWGEGSVLYEQNLAGSNVPVLLDEFGEGVEISVGDYFACLRRGQRSQVSCWGDNSYHQLGTTDTTATYRDTSITHVRAVSVGSGHTCAVTGSGVVYCWGFGRAGQLGDGVAYDEATPSRAIADRPVLSVSQAIDVAAGSGHSCALTASGGVYCWGGERVEGTARFQPYTAEPVRGGNGSELTGATAVCVGTLHSCALRETGEVVCWGENMFGQLGSGSTNPSPRNTHGASVLGDVVELACGAWHNCARTSTGWVYCWGDNSAGQLGFGSAAVVGRAVTPARVASLENVVGIYSGPTASHTCARTADGRVLCWGEGELGQLGLGRLDQPMIEEPRELVDWP